MNNLPYECVIQALRTANLLWRESRRLFRPFGITEAQYNVLHLLGQHPEGMSQKELSNLLVVDSSNVTLLLNRMEKRKWITRRTVLQDRRVYNVCLTSSGNTLWEKIRPHYRDAVLSLLSKEQTKEVETAYKILKIIESQVNQWSINHQPLEVMS